MLAMTQDVRFGWRALRRRPAYTAVAVLALALGIGANTTIFSFVDRLLFRPSSLPDAGRLMSIWETADRARPGGMGNRSPVSPANFRDWQAQNTVFEELAGYHWWNPSLSGVGEPDRVLGYRVTANFFTVLGLRPVLGTLFTAECEVPGRDDVLVLSHGLWQRRFGGAADVVGRAVQLDGRTFTVIAVMGRELDYPVGADAWAPLAWNPDAWASRDNRCLETIARLKPGVGPGSAVAEMRGLAQRLAEAFPQANEGRGVNPVSLQRRLVIEGGSTEPMVLAFASTLFVLLLVCANVANYQLARGLGRRQELAVRTALGATRTRLIRQLMVESVLLALMAGGLGTLLSLWGVELMKAAAPAHFARFLPGWAHIAVDVRILAFSLALSGIAGVLAGLTPALAVSRTRVSETLKDAAQSSTDDRRGHRLRDGLVVSEFLFALVVLTGTGLIVRSFDRLVHFDSGMRMDGVVVAQVTLPAARYPEAAQQLAFQQAVSSELARLPGLSAAALASHAPVDHGSIRVLEVDGLAPPAGGHPPLAALQAASPDYFRLLELPARRGRLVEDRDDSGAARVAVISEALGRTLFGTQDPVGRRFRMAGAAESEPWITIVGLVGDVRSGPFDGLSQALYVPVAQAPDRSLTLLARATGDTQAALTSLRTALRLVDPDLPLNGAAALRDKVVENLGGLRVFAGLLAVSGALALALSALGIYSVMSQTVAQSTRDIGIRIALGASRTDVLRWVLGTGLKRVGLALAIGLPLALATSWVLATQLMPELDLFRVDLVAVLGVGLLLCLTAAAACWIPAHRAARLDPLQALRHE